MVIRLCDQGCCDPARTCGGGAAVFAALFDGWVFDIEAVGGCVAIDVLIIRLIQVTSSATVVVAGFLFGSVFFQATSLNAIAVD